MKKLLVILLLSTGLLAQTTTTYSLKKTARDGAVTWSADLNSNLDSLDALLAGRTALSGITSGNFTSSTANPAASGIFRLANADAINARNQANNADINLLNLNSSNVAVVGGAAGISTSGILAITGGGAASGIVLFSDTGNPAAGTTGTNTTGVAHQLWYTSIYIPHNFVVSNMAVLSGGTATTDKVAMGIWSLAGTLLACTATTDAGGTTLSGANTWQKLAISASCPSGATTVALAGPAHYLVGVVTSGTNAGDIQTYPLANGPWASTASAQGTLATFTPSVTQTVSVAPYIMLQ